MDNWNKAYSKWHSLRKHKLRLSVDNSDSYYSGFDFTVICSMPL